MFTALAAGNPFVMGGGMNANDPWGSYNQNYNAAAATNQNLYQQAMTGYQNQLAQAQASLHGLDLRYGNLQKGVMRRLQGSNRANLTDIADQFTKFSGQLSQQMIDRGLGNTTVQGSMQTGVQQQFAKEKTRSNNAFAQLQADYQTRIGLARNQSYQAGIGMLSSLQGDQLRYLSSIQAPYPDPGVYAAMASRSSGGMGFGGMGMPGPSPVLGQIGGAGPRGSAFNAVPGVDMGGGGGGFGFADMGGYGGGGIDFTGGGGGGGGGIIAAMASAGAGAFNTAGFGGYDPLY